MLCRAPVDMPSPGGASAESDLSLEDWNQRLRKVRVAFSLRFIRAPRSECVHVIACVCVCVCGEGGQIENTRSSSCSGFRVSVCVCLGVEYVRMPPDHVGACSP